MEKAKFWQTKKNQIQCLLCSHYCTIAEGATGICGVRKNIQGELYSLVYGHPSALNVDPVEKKPLFHFLPGSLTYSLGTWGCNLRCRNCQNWDISQRNQIEDTIENSSHWSPAKIVEEALANNCRSIAYTYNEPTIFAEYALDIMKLAHQQGLKNIWVTNGFMSSECLRAIIPYLDAANVDLKSSQEEFYQQNCSARLQPILDNLKMLYREQIHLEITTLIIPSLSSSKTMLQQIANFIAKELDVEVPWHLSRFFPGISWQLKNLEATSDKLIYSAYNIAKDAGLKYVYLGNVPGDEKENTYCPHCGKLAIRRWGYEVERLDNQGFCKYCDTPLNIIL
ncbi:AmmeMemoRadiSam system radical SAM enzyme [Candidatus Parcubacteria bacterium]|nr:MAG: AmmeMemoRadiSam system radical SAM enzyme [Candidatus Parcubacteria bacterium]